MVAGNLLIVQQEIIVGEHLCIAADDGGVVPGRIDMVPLTIELYEVPCVVFIRSADDDVAGDAGNAQQ